jgi:hypothetical protein
VGSYGRSAKARRHVSRARRTAQQLTWELLRAAYLEPAAAAAAGGGGSGEGLMMALMSMGGSMDRPARGGAASLMCALNCSFQAGARIFQV